MHFLSIDIDYWNNHGIVDHNKERNCYNYLESLMRHPKVSYVYHHHQMLPLVNDSPCRDLINIDDHSDLTDTDIDNLNCGTWITYVKWRKEGSYTWVHGPDGWDCNGRDRPIFNKKYIRYKLSDWKYLNQSLRKPSQAFIENADQICVCLSPSFSDKPLQEIFHNWRKKYHIQGKRGFKKDPMYGRTLRPF